MSTDQWPEAGADLVLAIADTKLLLGHRFAQWTLAGETLEDDIGGAASAQEEVGQVRQLFSALEGQGMDRNWLEGDRTPAEFSSATSLDEIRGDWTAFLVTVGPVDRAAWYLLDAITHPDLRGLITKIGEDEYFHLEYLDARMQTLAEQRPDVVQSVLEDTVPHTLAFLGPATHDEAHDPLLESGFTDRSIVELRDSFREHYESLFSQTPVDTNSIDWSAPDPTEWDHVRRRVDDGGFPEQDLIQLRGAKNAQFAMR